MEASNEKTVIALKTASEEIKTFVESTENEVANIEEEYASIVPDAESKEGYDFCKKVRKDVLPIKTRMEGARKMLKDPISKMGKLIDSSLNPLKLRLEAVYKPFEDAYREKDNEKKIKEEYRQTTISTGFEKLNQLSLEALGQTSIGIESVMEEVGSFDFDPKIFMERTDQAINLQREIMSKLATMLTAQKGAEDLAEREKEIKQREEKMRFEEERADREQRDKEIRNKATKEAEAAAARAAKEAEEKAAQDAIAAEEKTKEREAAAARAERERIKRVQEAEKREAEKREANRKHKAKIHNEILSCIIKVGVTDEQAKAIIRLVSKGECGNMRISY